MRFFCGLPGPSYALEASGRYHPATMAVPKKRTSSARRDKRRANHKAGKARLNSCPRCHSPRLPHRVCPTCGTYAGREVVSHKIAEAPATGSDSE
jgi:large subunit ribosomal protein L32